MVVRSLVLLSLLSPLAQGDTLTHKFKSPSFSGITQSQHYLTIENQETSRIKAIKNEIQAELEELEREQEGSTINRFLRNFESRVYARLSKELTETLFEDNYLDPDLDGRFYFESEDYYIRYYMQDDGTLIMETYPGQYGEEGSYDNCEVEELCTRIKVPVSTFRTESD